MSLCLSHLVGFIIQALTTPNFPDIMDTFKSWIWVVLIFDISLNGPHDILKLRNVFVHIICYFLHKYLIIRSLSLWISWINLIHDFMKILSILLVLNVLSLSSIDFVFYFIKSLHCFFKSNTCRNSFHLNIHSSFPIRR